METLNGCYYSRDVITIDIMGYIMQSLIFHFLGDVKEKSMSNSKLILEVYARYILN